MKKDQTNQTEEQDTEQQGQDPSADESAETGNTDSGGAGEHMIPKSRFDEVNQKYKALKAEADKTAAAQAKADEERLKAQAEWKQLAEQREAELADLKAKVEAQAAAMLSERKRSAVIALAGEFNDPNDLLALIDLDAIDTDDDGKPVGVKGLVEKIAADKPYLLKSAKRQDPGSPGATGAKAKGIDEEAARTVQAGFIRNTF